MYEVTEVGEGGGEMDIYYVRRESCQ